MSRSSERLSMSRMLSGMGDGALIRFLIFPTATFTTCGFPPASTVSTPSSFAVSSMRRPATVMPSFNSSTTIWNPCAIFAFG